jgi:hypothetical protein
VHLRCVLRDTSLFRNPGNAALPPETAKKFLCLLFVLCVATFPCGGYCVLNHYFGQKKKMDQNLESMRNSIRDIDDRLKSIEALVASQNNDLLPELRELATRFNLHDRDMRSLIDQVAADLKAVRNFQDLEDYDLQRFPFLFVFSELKLKESLQSSTFGEVVNGVREMITRHYRVHFCCNVCGKMAKSGSKKFQRDRDLFQRTREMLSVVDHGQGGYELHVMKKSVAKFLKYAHIVLLALEWGVKFSGVPVPHLLSSVAKELCITDDMKRLVDSIEKVSPLSEKLEESLEKKLGRTLKRLIEMQFGGGGEGGGKKGGDDDSDDDFDDRASHSGSDVDDDDDDAKDKREIVKESLVMECKKTEAELLAEWTVDSWFRVHPPRRWMRLG